MVPGISVYDTSLWYLVTVVKYHHVDTTKGSNLISKFRLVSWKYEYSGSQWKAIISAPLWYRNFYTDTCKSLYTETALITHPMSLSSKMSYHKILQRLEDTGMDVWI